MSSNTLMNASDGARLPLRSSAVTPVVLAVLGTAAAAALLDWWLGLDGGAVWRAALVAAVLGILVVWRAARSSPMARFGAANAITLVRAAIAVLLLSLIGADYGTALGWTIVGLGTTAALLDGLDGRLARSRGEVSAFGARFDMETDAFLILVLALGAWQLGKAGAIIVLAGALRYVFVAASYGYAWLDVPLPPSRRRQTVCVLQVATLIAALAPIFVRPFSDVVALAGLVLLLWSFAVDVVWLKRHGRG
jgi:phosphatidylglycerophosphate synthase